MAKIEMTGNTKKFNIKGYALFPECDEDGVKFCLAIPNESAEKVIAMCKEINPDLDIVLAEIEHNENEYLGLHCKSRFTVPVFGGEGVELDPNSQFPVFWGAEVVANITLKEYEYKRKSGITAYLGGVTVLEQGLSRQTITAEDMLTDLI